MDTLFKIIKLPKLKMASFHVTESEAPEEIGAKKYKNWAESLGLFNDPAKYQVFGRNNPIPIDNPKLRGYEFLISITDNIDTNDIKTIELPEQLYVVVQSKGLEQMGKNWQIIIDWIKSSSQYTYGYPENYDHKNMPSLELEHHILPGQGPSLIDYYFPIKEK